MIRNFMLSDSNRIVEIHQDSKLPENCLPKLIVCDENGRAAIDPLFIVHRVREENDKVVMAAFAKCTAEIFVLVDHQSGTPEQRWEWLKEMTADMKRMLWLQGMEEMSAWIPRELEKTFAPRLKELGFEKSPWSSYTLRLKESGQPENLAHDAIPCGLQPSE
jgi:hypothetical protein